ncbi:FAD-dependent pyridine nucleotide-disulphide oxidoreductase (plasmid) [Sinorhizobium fredii NGR234]|uniref:FAD-dependent pyridine nucleotide-disulphide oxidoreductase n=1 Tax=Sinorhizobium fredii (strain NBRC 101917 / NGR234) TaxID=394 RepID=C3KKJ0_SINFN|nr:FAD-dependent oxidoreductase [Sinorhizobium fredii]ACP22926.1 FAD-dependent pyridine nucleotide-disulphide oxidoreductase [Sinorhizobium fredii NGR234]
MHYDCLIVGSGHGGTQAATSLRQHGFQGSIGLLSEDRDPPYERPPLSKDYLLGDKGFERILIRPAEFWASRYIDLLLGHEVLKVDARAKQVLCAQGATVSYGHLVWSAGGRPRRLSCPGHDLQGIHTIRTRSDVDRLVEDLGRAERVVVVGGGYIGLEAAAALTKLGKMVTVVEAMDRVLARVAAEPLSRFYEREHRDHGVEIRLKAGIESFVGSEGRLTGVLLTDGETLDADIAIVGIGILPCVEPLIEAGAAGGNGVDTDDHCRTSLPDVFAIGDCARVKSAHGLRIESVQNAHDQATAVAKTLCGDLTPFRATPWFWSNQYDLRLQTVGLSAGFDGTVVRGDPSTRSFSILYLRDGAVVALDCINCVRDYVEGRMLVEKAARISPEVLANSSVRLKSLAAA